MPTLIIAKLGDLRLSNTTVLSRGKRYEVDYTYEKLMAKYPELVRLERSGKVFISEDAEIDSSNPYAIILRSRGF